MYANTERLPSLCLVTRDNQGLWLEKRLNRRKPLFFYTIFFFSDRIANASISLGSRKASRDCEPSFKALLSNCSRPCSRVIIGRSSPAPIISCTIHCKMWSIKDVNSIASLVLTDSDRSCRRWNGCLLLTHLLEGVLQDLRNCRDW